MAERDDEYTEFVRSMAGTLRRTAYLVCGDWHRADDAVQDALYKLYLAWPRVHRSRQVQAYARRATVHAAIDTGRRPWRRETATAVPPDREIADRTNDHADRDELLSALAVLGPRQRACLVLRFFDGLSVDQTAEILDCSTGTVKSQTSRGLDNLRDHLTRTRSANRVS